MKFPWKIVKITHTPADVKLEQIKEILFPPLELQTRTNGVDTLKYHIDYSVDTNLDAVLTDLQEGHNDPATQKTLTNMITKIHQVRKILEAYSEIDSEAKYIIVDDDSRNEPEIRAIEN